MSSQCVEIKVFGLSREAQNRLGGVTEAVLDLSADFSLRLSKDVEKLSRTNKISTEGALGFEAEFTKINDAIFCEFASPVTLDSETQSYRVGVTAQGHGLQFDRLVVIARTDKWQLELRRSPDHWVELASQYTTNQIDFSQFQMEVSAIEDNWDKGTYEGTYPYTPAPFPGDTAPVHFPLIDYGGWCDETLPIQDSEKKNVKAVGVEDFRPWLSFPYLLKQGFCLFGWTLDGVIFDAPWVRSLWVYALRPDYHIGGTVGGYITGRSFTRYDVNTATSGKGLLYFDENVRGFLGYYVTELVAGNLRRLCGVTNFQGIALKYTFILKGEFHNDRVLFFNSSMCVEEIEQNGPNDWVRTGEILSETYLDTYFDPGDIKYIDFEQTITLKPGQSAIISFTDLPSADFFAETGLYFECRPASDCLMTHDLVNISDCVSDENTILDWTKAFCDMVDGRAETNLDTKTVTIHTNKRADVYGTVVPPFLKTEESAIDISGLIVNGSIKIKPVNPQLKRYTSLEFANSSDSYISSLNLSQPAHFNNFVRLPHFLIISFFIAHANHLRTGLSSQQSVCGDNWYLLCSCIKAPQRPASNILTASACSDSGSFVQSHIGISIFFSCGIPWGNKSAQSGSLARNSSRSSPGFKSRQIS